MKQNIMVGFDVDGTLITFEDKPRYDIIELYHKFKALGCTVVVASGGGQGYAETWCNRLGLVPDQIACKFSICGHPDIWFDDEEVNIGIINMRV